MYSDAHRKVLEDGRGVKLALERAEAELETLREEVGRLRPTVEGEVVLGEDDGEFDEVAYKKALALKLGVEWTSIELSSAKP